MKIIKPIKYMVLIISGFYLFNLIADLLNQKSDIANLLGLTVAGLYVILSTYLVKKDIKKNTNE